MNFFDLLFARPQPQAHPAIVTGGRSRVEALRTAAGWAVRLNGIPVPGVVRFDVLGGQAEQVVLLQVLPSAILLGDEALVQDYQAQVASQIAPSTPQEIQAGLEYLLQKAESLEDNLVRAHCQAQLRESLTLFCQAYECLAQSSV